MTSTNIPAIGVPATKASALRYLSCLRPLDVVVLQGAPLLGAAFALRHPHVLDVVRMATLIAANILLVTHVFMLNDWAGLSTDLADPNKSAHVFSARGVGRTEMGWLNVALLISSLLLFGTLGRMTFALAFAIAALSALYSLPRFNWKGKPLFNSAAHLGGGLMHFLLGYSVAGAIDVRGVAIATFFALVFAAGHLTQETRDHEGDTINAIRTNAVAFGPRRTFAASVMLFTLAHVVLFALAFEAILPPPLAAVVSLFALQLVWSLQTLRDGLTYASISRLQARYRVLYAIIGATMVIALCALH